MSFEIPSPTDLNSTERQMFLYFDIRENNAICLAELGILQKAEAARAERRQDKANLMRELGIIELPSKKFSQYVLTQVGVALMAPATSVEHEEEIEEVSAILFNTISLTKTGKFRPDPEFIPMFTVDEYGLRAPTYDFTTDDIREVDGMLDFFSRASAIGALPDLSDDYTHIKNQRSALAR